MLHVAIGDASVDCGEFKPTNKGNIMLKETIRALKQEKETRYLEKHVTGFSLVFAKAGVRKHGDNAIAALLKEFV